MGFGLFLCLTSFLVFITAGDATTNALCPIQIYQFGDSISDTGNGMLVFPPGFPADNPPYGKTFPGFPTGRMSNGKLIIDYIATALGLPLLNPYLNKNASFEHGVDFAVSGATAPNSSFFASRGVQVQTFPGSSLDLQLDWYRTYLASICSPPFPGCGDRLKHSLHIVGVLGINDINYQLIAGQSLGQISATVPAITQAFTDTIRELIQSGARRVLVPGNFPIGCFPFGLAALPSANHNSYDALGCLKSLNELVIYQNNYLQAALISLRAEFPGVTIIYVDYYDAFLSVFISAPFSGFDPNALKKPCCGTNDFDVTSSSFCGSPGVPVCPNPNQYISWDGIHLTQETYRRIAQIVIPRYVLPAIATICFPLNMVFNE